MTAHILVVEDDPDFIRDIGDVLKTLSNGCDVKVAKSRDSAFALLNDEFFDIVVLDLNLPTSDGMLDGDSLHGFSVFSRVRSVATGTPVFVLTGSSADDFISELVRSSNQIDVWGEGRVVSTVNFLQKFKFDQFQELMKPSIAAIDALREVELDRGAVQLTLAEDRLIRIFARSCGGRRALVSLLGGGLSGAKVLRLRVTDTQGVLIHDAVAKIGSTADVVEERKRFDLLIGRLEQDATPRKLTTLEAGASSLAGVFYGLAAGFEETGFQVAMGNATRAGAAISSAESRTQRWREGVQQSPRQIQVIRRRMLSDEGLSVLLAKYGLPWIADFEAMQIQTRWCCGHGDLHGENMLVRADGSTVLIDYGDVGEGTASLDPITLELSLLFHVNGPLRGAGVGFGAWPTREQAAAWGSIDFYVAGCPAEAFVRACRAWAHRSAAGQREMAATAYSYLVRQLKYDDTNKELALALLNGVKAFYDAT